MSSPVPLPVTRANPPIGTRSGPRHCWPPSASVCPRSAWSRWSPSSPRGSTRWRTTTVTAKNLMARDIKTAESYECEWEEWVWMREPFKPREEREWWETALDRRPLKIFFLCMYDLPISMINYCVWVLPLLYAKYVSAKNAFLGECFGG